MIFNFLTNVVILHASATMGNPPIRKIDSRQFDKEKCTTNQNRDTISFVRIGII